ncbi:hypothetical protein FKR81_12095 [Lentzea tibetensis]|uniref:Uncharacterized protein n=1 Tax=Lentzea tibetensis TaxID=2591470 RepID=A0A563EXB0_9PSEU|nr:hypothetical protein [Lentzea tibetensis]TWP52299.1 hypothetical protein FKR81_12095 [Lentzea tibetensis]
MANLSLDSDELLLPRDVVAVDVPASWGGEVSHQLTFAGPLGPILALPGRRTRWLFLARWDTRPHTPPPDVRYWRDRVPAPTAHWVVRPGDALPLVSVIRCAIRTVRP